MSKRVNRRELIVDTAADLFTQHGYDATSIRQIADQVGVTESALYYHFKEGKRELLREVLECHMPDFQSVLQDCQNATSLQDCIIRFGSGMAKKGPGKLTRMRWIITEFPRMSPEERALLHSNHIHLHDELAAVLREHLPNDESADQFAWMIICLSFGYGQLFINLDLQSVVDFKPEQLVSLMASIFEAQ